MSDYFIFFLEHAFQLMGEAFYCVRGCDYFIFSGTPPSNVGRSLLLCKCLIISNFSCNTPFAPCDGLSLLSPSRPSIDGWSLLMCWVFDYFNFFLEHALQVMDGTFYCVWVLDRLIISFKLVNVMENALQLANIAFYYVWALGRLIISFKLVNVMDGSY